MPCGVGVVDEDFGRVVSRCHPVVHLACAVCHPASAVGRKFDSTHGGQVPQESIASAGDHERDRDLRVALYQVHD